MATRAKGKQPGTRRYNIGKDGHGYMVDGVKCQGVTSLISKAVPKNLSGWAAEAGARFVLNNKTMIGQVEEDAIVQLARKAPFQERDVAAVKGKEIHAYAEKIATAPEGVEIEVPDHLLGYVDSYLDWREWWKPTDEISERSVVSRRYRYSGTLDLIATLPELGRTLIDYKTGKDIYGETALQLAAYGNAETMYDPDEPGTETPMEHIDAFAVLHLKHDAWAFYRFDVTQAQTDPTFRTFLYVAQVARWLMERGGWKPTGKPIYETLAMPAAKLEVIA